VSTASAPRFHNTTGCKKRKKNAKIKVCIQYWCLPLLPSGACNPFLNVLFGGSGPLRTKKWWRMRRREKEKKKWRGGKEEKWEEDTEGEKDKEVLGALRWEAKFVHVICSRLELQKTTFVPVPGFDRGDAQCNVRLSDDKNCRSSGAVSASLGHGETELRYPPQAPWKTELMDFC
jgi:hypothetical protein